MNPIRSHCAAIFHQSLQLSARPAGPARSQTSRHRLPDRQTDGQTDGRIDTHTLRQPGSQTDKREQGDESAAQFSLWPNFSLCANEREKRTQLENCVERASATQRNAAASQSVRSLAGRQTDKQRSPLEPHRQSEWQSCVALWVHSLS